MSISINTSLYSNLYSNYSAFGVGSTKSGNIFQPSNVNNSNKVTSAFDTYSLLDLKYGANNAKRSLNAANAAIKTLGSQVSSLISSLNFKGSKSVFNNIGAVSSNNKVATANVSNKITLLSNTKNLSPIGLNVKQVATAQVNAGNSLKSANLEKAVGIGSYSFAIDTGGKTQQFSINISVTDNNESIQKKMADAINSKNTGITASVSYDSENKTSQLSLTSTDTGNKKDDGSPVFTVRDITGDLAEKMGITQITQQAQNAVYSVNGGQEETSLSNTVYLGNSVTTTLKEAGETTINFQKDGSESVRQVKELVGALNNALVEALKGNDRGSDRLGRDITSMNKSYSSTLSKVGINVSAGGMLSVDEDKLKKASEDGSLEKLFQGNGSMGFANRANRIASNMKTSNYYGDSYSYNQKTINANFSNLYNYYSQYGSAGALFDSWF